MAKHLTDTQLAHFKEMLLDQKANAEAGRADIDALNREQPMTEESETADFDPNDPADEASDLNDRTRDMAGAANMTAIIAKIDRALQKIEDGTYGLSDIDGTPIPVARLEALPYDVTTVQQEEEDVL